MHCNLLNPKCMEPIFKLLLFLQLIVVIVVTTLTYFTCAWLANYLNTVQYKYILHQTSSKIFIILLVIHHVSVRNVIAYSNHRYDIPVSLLQYNS